jgi:hypothetical protein
MERILAAMDRGRNLCFQNSAFHISEGGLGAGFV